MAVLAKVKAESLAEMDRIEAAVFRFSRRVRAFVDAFPDDMPTPASITPTYRGGEGTERDSRSYFHMSYLSRVGVEAWAARWGTDVTSDPGREPGWGDYVSAESVVDGMRVIVGCIEYAAEPAGGAG